MKTQKNYYILDEYPGAFDTDKLNEQTEEEAIKRAKREYDRLSEHDKKRRTRYELIYASEDEEGVADLKTAETIKEYK